MMGFECVIRLMGCRAESKRRERSVRGVRDVAGEKLLSLIAVFVVVVVIVVMEHHQTYVVTVHDDYFSRKSEDYLQFSG